jgi:RNA polymerase sigma-70 factor (ECF subfamily)
MSAEFGADARSELRSASDADLIRRVSAGNPLALEVLYDRYSRVVYSFALRIVGDSQVAEEILQEVFFRAWQQGGSFQSSRGSLITWLLSITHNLSIDEVRRKRRRPQKADAEEPESILSGLADEGQDVEEEVWLSSLRSTIEVALEQLPAPQREAIELAYFQGLTQREIADRLEEPLGTIKTRMRLGMLKLREQLSKHMSDVAERDEVQLT